MELLADAKKTTDNVGCIVLGFVCSVVETQHESGDIASTTAPDTIGTIWVEAMSTGRTLPSSPL